MGDRTQSTSGIASTRRVCDECGVYVGEQCAFLGHTVSDVLLHDEVALRAAIGKALAWLSEDDKDEAIQVLVDALRPA